MRSARRLRARARPVLQPAKQPAARVAQVLVPCGDFDGWVKVSCSKCQAVCAKLTMVTAAPVALRSKQASMHICTYVNMRAPVKRVCCTTSCVAQVLQVKLCDAYTSEQLSTLRTHIRPPASAESHGSPPQRRAPLLPGTLGGLDFVCALVSALASA